MTGRDKPTSKTELAKLKSFDDFEMRLGDMMRGERATLGKSLLDVQRDLKIKAAYIAAIENSDPTAFETQGFVAGYVRSYARYLGMDPEVAFEAFCRESGFETAHGMAVGANAAKKKASERRSKANADPLIASRTPYLPEVAGRFSELEPRAIASLSVLVVLIGGIGWGAWSVLQEIQRVSLAPVAQTPGVVSTVDPLLQVAVPEEEHQVTLADEEAVAALDRLYQPQALELPVMAERDGPIGAVDPSTVGILADFAEPPQVEAAPVIDQESVDLALQDAPEDPQIQVVEDGPSEVVLFAVRPAWVRVLSADGTVLFEKILDAGERYKVPSAEAPAILRAGNSGSVYFEIDGDTYGPAGPAASVAKNVALGPEDLRTAYQIADIEADPALKRIAELAKEETEAEQ